MKGPYPSLKHDHTGQTVFTPGKEVSEEKSKVRFSLILTPFTEVTCCALISVKQPEVFKEVMGRCYSRNNKDCQRWIDN